MALWLVRLSGIGFERVRDNWAGHHGGVSGVTPTLPCASSNEKPLVHRQRLLLIACFPPIYHFRPRSISTSSVPGIFRSPACATWHRRQRYAALESPKADTPRSIV